MQIRGEDGTVLAPARPVSCTCAASRFRAGTPASARSSTTQGWFPTKDVATLDEDGYLFIGGRSDDTIIRGGENIAPAEIEDVLVEHPEVHEVAVVGVDDPQWGQAIVAVVVPEPAPVPEPEELRELRAQEPARLAYPRPRRVPRRAADQRDRQGAAP